MNPHIVDYYLILGVEPAAPTAAGSHYKAKSLRRKEMKMLMVYPINTTNVLTHHPQ
ncbi:MAG: hypothetical protein ACK498_02430 [Cyclobacteriaceae bacterium]